MVCPDGLLGALTNGTYFTVSALAEARRKAVEEMKNMGKGLGANAIIGVDLDISDLKGGILVSANGTAVKVIQRDYDRIKQEMDDYYEKISIEKRNQMQEKIDREKQLNDIFSSESSDFSQTDQLVVKLINKLGESNAFGLMRSLPKSIQEAELLQSLDKLCRNGVIEITEGGKYRMK